MAVYAFARARRKKRWFPRARADEGIGPYDRRHDGGLRIRPGAEVRERFHRAGGASPSPTDRQGRWRIVVRLYRVAALRDVEDAVPYAF